MFRIGLLIALLVTLPASAQDAFPSRPIRILVGYSAGGGNDLIVRLIAPKMSESLGQAVVVENKPGAQSIIACELVAKSTPDGYTLLLGPSGPMTMNPATYARLPYSPTRDFAPVSMIGSFPLILTVSAASPLRSVQDLVAYAKANPGKSSYAASAAPFQIASELFKQKTGTDFLHVPYKGSGESVQSVVAGQVTMTFADAAPVMGPIRGGTARALAVSSPQRHPTLPDVPTFTEAGLADMDILLWTALFAPAGTPQPVVARLQSEVARVVRLPEVREGLAKLGVDPVGGTSDELARTVQRDIDRWSAVAKAAGIRNN
ncbi:MAG: Bug family tripartite tricarboxylate transporter substrate binding protein [Clostridia bacterium]